MAKNPGTNPFGVFNGLDGRPLNGGKVYIGLANLDPETNPQQVYWDDAGEIPASQPLNTISGYIVNTGTPARFWTANNSYSIRVRNQQNVEVFYSANVAFALPDGAVTADSLINTDAGLQAITAKLQFLQSGTSAVSRTVQSKLRDVAGAFDFLTTAQIADVEAGTALVDVTTALQAALDAHKTVYFPNGTYLISAKLIPQIKSVLIGETEHGVILKGNHSGILLEYPITNIDCQIKNISFAGASCTGIAVAATAGTLHDYLIRAQIESCHFHYELAYGINADLIYGRLRNNSFGYYGTGSDTNTMVALRSHAVSTNYTNLNRVECCLFFSGTTTASSVDISGGDNWLFDTCNWEQGGIAITISNVNQLRFVNCWFEANTVATTAGGAVVALGATTTPVVFESCNFVNNTCYSVVKFSGGVTRGLSISNSTIAKQGSSVVLYDTVTLVSTTLPADGTVTFYGNTVSGGAAGDAIVTGTEFRGGSTSPRLSMCGGTTTAGSITASNDPGLTISRNGVGDVSLTVSHPLASATNKIRALVTGQSANSCRVLLVSTTQVRVQLFTDAGAAQDGVFSLIVYGS